MGDRGRTNLAKVQPVISYMSSDNFPNSSQLVLRR